MASLINNPKNSRKQIQFIHPMNRKHQTFRLLKGTTMKQAQAFKVKLEQLITASITGSLDDETSRWLVALDDKTYSRLAKFKLVQPRNTATLDAFLQSHFKASSVKESTATMYGHTHRCLVEFFGKDRQVRSITHEEGQNWRQFLKSQGLSDSTISRRVVVARGAFKRAMRWKLIQENPFDDVKAGPQTNKARMFYVSQEDSQKVLDACPDSQWRLLFALSRYGGLRCPSEHLALKWSDVNWEKDRILVRSIKTEHHEGKGERVIPIFPELRPYLLEAFEAAEPGTEWVITKYRMVNMNLRTQLNRIIKRAGLKPWPKLFQNLRSTRQTAQA